MAEGKAEEKAEEAQAIEGYGCSCGWVTLDKKEFNAHCFNMSRDEGKGTHTSIGRVNVQTGEITMPPWRKRTKEQRKASAVARRGKKAEESVVEGVYSKGGQSNAPVRTTEILADASQVKFIPRVYTTDYSPIMRAAQEAAHEFWRWPADMTLGDFIDTALHLLFKEHGINLAGYTITEEAQKALQAQKAEEAS